MTMLLNKTNSEQVRYICKKSEDPYCVVLNIKSMIKGNAIVVDNKIEVTTESSKDFIDDKTFDSEYKIIEIEY